MKKAASSAFLICVALAGAANATTISSSFDTDLDGWTGQGGILVWNSTGGNPGGFLQQNDTGNSNMHVVAPAKFLGNLNGFTLTVDIRQLVGSPAGTFGGFGAIAITGGGGLTMNADLGSAALAWTTYTMPFSALPSVTTRLQCDHFERDKNPTRVGPSEPGDRRSGGNGQLHVVRWIVGCTIICPGAGNDGIARCLADRGRSGEKEI